MAPPRPPGLDGPLARWIIKWMSAVQAWTYRVTGGRLGARFVRGTRVLLLTTRGRKSGEPRVKPLLYLEDGERIVVVASSGGQAEHPQWYRNLVADPRVSVQIGATRGAYLARTATAEEKGALWPRLVAMYSDFDNYQAWTERKIPVVVLEPASSPEGHP